MLAIRFFCCIVPGTEKESGLWNFPLLWGLVLGLRTSFRGNGLPRAGFLGWKAENMEHAVMRSSAMWRNFTRG